MTMTKPTPKQDLQAQDPQGQTPKTFYGFNTSLTLGRYEKGSGRTGSNTLPNGKLHCHLTGGVETIDTTDKAWLAKAWGKDMPKSGDRIQVGILYPHTAFFQGWVNLTQAQGLKIDKIIIEYATTKTDDKGDLQYEVKQVPIGGISQDLSGGADWNLQEFDGLSFDNPTPLNLPIYAVLGSDITLGQKAQFRFLFADVV